MTLPQSAALACFRGVSVGRARAVCWGVRAILLTCAVSVAACAPKARPLAMPGPDYRLLKMESPNVSALSVSVSGYGSVFVAASNELCAQSSCLFALDTGTPITVEAHAAPTHRFVGWEGACAGQGETCSLTLDSSELLVAHFEAVKAAGVVTVR